MCAAMEVEAADFAEAVTTALNEDPGSLVWAKVMNPRKASQSGSLASQSCKVLAAQTLAKEGPASLDEPRPSTSGMQESPTIPAISFYGARATIQKSSSTTDAAQSNCSIELPSLSIRSVDLRSRLRLRAGFNFERSWRRQAQHCGNLQGLKN